MSQPLSLVNYKAFCPYPVLMVLSKQHKWFHCSCIQGQQKTEGMELWNDVAMSFHGKTDQKEVEGMCCYAQQLIDAQPLVQNYKKSS